MGKSVKELKYKEYLSKNGIMDTQEVKADYYNGFEDAIDCAVKRLTANKVSLDIVKSLYRLIEGDDE